MASWCCPHVSSGEVRPSVYVRMRYERMAARCPTAERSRPAVHECCLPVPKRKVATCARPSRRVVRSGDVSERVLRRISPRIAGR
jgi:hypothetical protein